MAIIDHCAIPLRRSADTGIVALIYALRHLRAGFLPIEVVADSGALYIDFTVDVPPVLYCLGRQSRGEQQAGNEQAGDCEGAMQAKGLHPSGQAMAGLEFHGEGSRVLVTTCCYGARYQHTRALILNRM